MARTPQEIFEHHITAIGAGDVDAILEDYAEDAVLITPQGTVRGRPAIRETFTGLLGQLPDAAWDVYTRIYEGDVLFIEWSATGEKARIQDGIDTFVFRGDAIRVQTVRFTLEPAS
jgi:ketosteroid isomerase-like protein